MSLPPGVVGPHPDGVVVTLWVVPAASRDEVVGFHGGALRVRVAAPADGGRANRAAAALVARTLGGEGGTVVAGRASRSKRVVVAGVSPSAAAACLERFLGER